MKKRQLEETKQKSIAELEKALSELRQKKLETQVKISSGKEQDLKAVSKIRRDIAQIMTLLRLKAMEGQAIKGIIERSEEKEAKEK